MFKCSPCFSGHKKVGGAAVEGTKRVEWSGNGKFILSLIYMGCDWLYCSSLVSLAPSTFNPEEKSVSIQKRHDTPAV